MSSLIDGYPYSICLDLTLTLITGSNNQGGDSHNRHNNNSDDVQAKNTVVVKTGTIRVGVDTTKEGTTPTIAPLGIMIQPPGVYLLVLYW